MKRPVTPVPLLLLLLLLAILSSCRRDASFHDALVRAEALMETDPQQARAVLAEIEDSILKIEDYPAEEAGQKTGKNFQFSIFNFQSKGEAALYALLRTQADYKCDVPLTSDSLILLATNYYGTKRKSQRAALAQHYLGCTYIGLHRDLDAIEAQLRATTLFPDTTNKYYAHSLLQLGLLYSKHYMVDSAWVAFGRYRQTEACNSDSANISYADYYMGTAALYKDNDNLTDSLFQRVLCNTKTINHIRFTTYFQLAKLRFYHQHDIEGALAYLEKIGGYWGKGNGALLMLKADILAQQRQPATAYEYYKKAIQNSSDIYVQCTSYEGLASVAPLLNKPDSTRYFIEQYKGTLDSIYTMNRQREITEIKDKHIVELHDRELAAQRSRLYWMWGILFTLFVLVTSLVVLWNDRRHKAKALKYEQRLKDIERRYIQENASIADEDEEGIGLASAVMENASSPSSYFSLQEERLALYRNQYLTSRWAGYFIAQQGEMDAKGLMPTADSEQFLQYLSELFVNMLVDLHRENGRLNRDDMDYCCMTMLGFSINQIAYCCRKPVKYCYNRRTRLGERLTAEWYQFIFGKQPKQA